MKIAENLADDAILKELGVRLVRRRLDANMTQAELAEKAGVAKRTVERMKAGGRANAAFESGAYLPRVGAGIANQCAGARVRCKPVGAIETERPRTAACIG